MTHSPIPLLLLCLCCISGLAFAQEIPGSTIPLMEDPEGLTITGTRETSQQMKVINREEIEKANAPDLASLLEETAGLSTARYGPRGSQGDINLRGFDSERVAFLIDGIPANSPASGEFDFNQIDLASIEKIEVIYGGSDSRYNVSGALGGVINIITVKKQKPGLRIGAGLSNLSAMPGSYYKPNAGNRGPQWQDLADAQNVTLSAGLGLERWSWNASWFGNRAANHFLYVDPYGRKRRKESSEIWDTGLSTALIHEFENLSTLAVGGSFYYGDKNIPKNGYTDLADKLYDVSTHGNIMLEMPRIFHDSLGMEVSLSHTMERQDSSEGITTSQAVMGINRWSWSPLDFLTLRIGGDYRYAFINTVVFHDRHDGGVYLAAEWTIRSVFTIIPSIKGVFRGGEGTSEAVPIPKLGLVWKALPTLTIKNNYFRSFKFPDLDDLYWQSSSDKGDPNLKSEDGWGTDLGFVWKPGQKGFFRYGMEGNAYVQWYDNSIHWYSSGGGGAWKPQNVGGALFYGGDLASRFEFHLNKGPFTLVALSPSYHYMMSYLLAYGYTFGSDRRVPYMPVHRVGAQVELAWKSGSLSVQGRYEDRRVTQDFISYLDPYFLLMINANQKITENLSAFTVIRNALNQEYQSFKDYPMPGITVTMGIRLRWDIALASQQKKEAAE